MGRQIVPDPAGEFSAETGTGNVTKVERDPAKRNALVHIRADHLERPIKGWLDTHDLVLLGALEACQQQHAGRLAYRIDVRRDKNVDAGLPWGDVPQTARFRRLVAITTEDQLASLLPAPIMATVGAPAEASSSPPARTSTASSPPPAERDHHTGAPICPVCGETTAGRPVRRTPRGYIHTDNDCFSRPFDDDGFDKPDTVADDPDAVAPPAAPAGDPAGGMGILAAGLAATAQRAAHRDAPTPPPAEASPSSTPAEPTDWTGTGIAVDVDGVYICTTCGITSSDGDPAAHAASAAHQGKARQADQVADLQARKTAATKEASTFADEGAPTRPPTIPIPGRQQLGPRVMEGRPWERYNSDGSINMGSYAITAALGMVELAQRLAVRRLQTIADETGAQQHLDLGQVRALARYLLEAADRCQAHVRDDGHSDRMDNSHTRSRGAVRMALDVYPVPWGAEPDVRAKWIEDLSAHAAFLLNLAVELDR